MNPSPYEPPLQASELKRTTRARSFVRFMMFFLSALLPPWLGSLMVTRPERRSRAGPRASPGWHRRPHQRVPTRSSRYHGISLWCDRASISSPLISPSCRRPSTALTGPQHLRRRRRRSQRASPARRRASLGLPKVYFSAAGRRDNSCCLTTRLCLTTASLHSA